jgi:hypothetical protein
MDQFEFVLICKALFTSLTVITCSIYASIFFIILCVFTGPHGPHGPGSRPRVGGSVGRAGVSVGRVGQVGRTGRSVGWADQCGGSGWRVGRMNGSVGRVGRAGRSVGMRSFVMYSHGLVCANPYNSDRFIIDTWVVGYDMPRGVKVCKN